MGLGHALMPRLLEQVRRAPGLDGRQSSGTWMAGSTQCRLGALHKSPIDVTNEEADEDEVVVSEKKSSNVAQKSDPGATTTRSHGESEIKGGPSDAIA